MDEDKRTPSEKQEYRRKCAEKLAGILEPMDLEAVSLAGRVDRGLYYSSLLRLEAQPDNHVIQTGTASDEQGGGTYEQGTALYRPSLRISPTYSQEIRRRATREAKAAIRRANASLSLGEREQAAKGRAGCYRWKLVTITMQHEPGTNTFDEIMRFNRAFSLLRKRDMWKEHVRAGIKGVEDRLTAKGSHVHAHLMILARYWDQKEASQEWAEVLGREGNVKIQAIKDRRPFGNEEGPECSLQHALKETCKYITKTSDLIEPDEDGEVVSRETLIRLCDVLRWPRMFEILGAARQRRRAASAEGALDLILPEYSTAQAEGSVEPGESWIIYLSVQDSEKAKGWRILESGDVVNLDQESPPRKKIRSRSWRELMFQVEPWRWFEMIEHRCNKMMERRRYFLERKTGFPVYCISSGTN
jgi:Replication protein